MIISVGEHLFPSFVLELLCKYLDYPLTDLEIIPGSHIRLSNVSIPGNDSAGDLTIPIDDNGMINVNYLGPWTENIDQVYSAGQVLWYAEEPLSMEDYFRDKIVVFAEVSNRSGDYAAIPVDPNFPRSAIYANVLNSILTQDYIKQTGLVTEIGILLLFAALITFFCVFLKMVYFSISYFIMIPVYGVLNTYLFVEFNAVHPVISVVIPATVIFIYSAAFKFYHQEKNRLIIETSFKAYMPPSILKKIENDPDFLSPGGENRDVTVCFADIRKFSKLAEELSPAELIKLLNRYYSLLVRITFDHGGTIDKFTGDEIMIIFGAPESKPSDHLNALKMVIEWDQELKAFNDEIMSEGFNEISIGIGLNYGRVVAGNIGSEMRMDYSVLGDVINKAARIVSDAAAGEIKMGEAYYRLVEEYIEVDKLEPFEGKPGEALVQSYLFKGLKKPLPD